MKASIDRAELSGYGIYHIAANSDIGSHQRMIADQVYCLRYCLLHLIEAVKPAVKIYAAMPHKRDIAFGHTTLFHQMQHLIGVHTLNATFCMADYHYLFHS